MTEIEGQLHRAGQVTLDSSGNGVLTFDPSSARERWEVRSVVVTTNQAATATVVPVATVGKNTVVASQLSQGNNRGQSWAGNQDVFDGLVDISPADYLSVLFTAAPGTASTVQTASGSHAAPAAFTTLASMTLPVGGLWQVTWSVTLAGTVGSGDVNNFALFQNTTLIADSVNTGSVGTYAQAAETFSVDPANPFVELTSGSHVGTAGSTYSCTMTAQSPLAGVIAYATVTGTRYTRRS